jgi:uncharacterized cupredoxin-like copper-binding protein
MRRSMKRIISLLVAAAAVATVTLLAVVPFAGASSTASTATTVRVTAKEFKFVLSRRSAPHGLVIFRVVNRGRIKHDFKIAGKKTPILKPGGRATLRVRLRKGRHRYVCTVDAHASFGMKGVFKST